MEMTEAIRDGIVILALNGRLDASNAGTLEDKVLGLIAGGNQRFVIDGAHLDYISSAGLRVLLVAAKRLKASDGRIVVASLNEHIQEVFDIAGFSSIFAIYRSAEEAIADIR
jgi:anti-sigma B factor antagonist